MISQAGPTAFSQTFWCKAQRQPMLWGAVAYAGGIIVGVHAWRPPLWWVLAAFALILSAAYFRSRRPGFAWILAMGIVLSTGAIHVQIRSGSNRLDTTIQNFADRQPVQIVAHVIRDGRLRQTGAEFREIVDVESEELQTETGLKVPVHSGVRLAIYSPHDNNSVGEEASAGHDGTRSMRMFRYGERIRCLATVRRPRNFRNPGAFDYEGYLAERGIAALGSAKAQEIEVLSGFTGSRMEWWRTRVHRSVTAKVHELWPAREAALIDAMMIGEDAFIDRDTRTDFQRSGTYHVLVVSGMNVSILAFVLFWTLRRLHFTDIPATLITIFLCVAYAFMTEVGAPVWRATLMCAVYLLTRLLYRDRAMVNGIGTAALALLIYDPRQILTASFQMTFVCVLIVAAISVPVLQRTSQLYKQAWKNWDSIDYASQLPPTVAQFRVELQFMAARLALFVGETWSRRIICSTVSSCFAAFELVFISTVMQVGLAAPMAYYFHRATTLGLPANLMVVPLTQLMMPSAILALGLGYMWPGLAKLPLLAASLAVDGITGTVRGLGGLQLADFRVPTPSLVVTAAAAAALVLAMWGVRRHRLVAYAALGVMLLGALAVSFVAPVLKVLTGVIEVTSIDVGEGDSTLLISPGGETLLIDAGGPIGPATTSQFDFGEDVVSPYLWSRGISRLSAVAITHGHSDHAGGVAAVLKNFKPTELWLGLEPPSALLENVLATAQSLNIKVVRRREGERFQFGGANIEVLYPAQNAAIGDKPRNNDSMILRASYGETSVLLEGDAEKRVERYVVATHHPTATLLKVGHHGSANATTQEFLDSVKPQVAIISVGSANSFGLPRVQTLARLAQMGSRVYRTDLDGAVTFYLDGHAVRTSVAALQ
jgi:competence protein ComEC